jgi:hypothetical protein
LPFHWKPTADREQQLTIWPLLGEPDDWHSTGCDCPSWVNPSHLRIGTHAENVADKVARRRQARGERHGRAKLDDDAVRAIRVAFAAGEKYIVLARRHGVTSHTNSAIARDRVWKHVT